MVDTMGSCGRLREQRALVTGAASGIGLAVAQKLCAEGARVVMADLREAALSEAAAAIGVAALPLACDVGSESDVDRLFAGVEQSLGGLDVVVTCAGIVRVGQTHELPLESWETLMRVNLTGTFLVLRGAINAMRRSGGGAIVTIGSVASVVAAGRTSAYDASKGGVLQLTRAIAVENAAHGIRANCVLPGVVRTPLAENSTALYGPLGPVPASLPASRTRVPIERPAEPAEIAAVVAFLASSESSFMTGAAIPVDGGYTAI